MGAALATADRVFHALGDPTRRAIVERLCNGATSATELAEPLAITLTAVVQHLRILEDAGLVASAKVGRVRRCRVEPKAFSAIEAWVAERLKIWERRLDRLEKLLEDEEG